MRSFLKRLTLVFSLSIMPTQFLIANRIGWIGKGGADEVVTSPGDPHFLTLSKDENCTNNDLGSHQALGIFDDSEKGVHDCIHLQYTHTDKPDDKGGASWMTAVIPALGWAPFDISKQDWLAFYLKGLPPGKNFTLSLTDGEKHDTGKVNVADHRMTLQSDGWAKISIPLRLFPGIKKLNLKKVTSIILSADSLGSYNLYLDNIVFDKTKVSKEHNHRKK